jgi:hypothetical protein
MATYQAGPPAPYSPQPEDAVDLLVRPDQGPVDYRDGES